MKKICEDIQEMLVDYADGILQPAESKMIELHLVECHNCRKLLESLQRSLELAGVIWEDNLASLDNIRIHRKSKSRIHIIKYAAVAASILIISTVTAIWYFNKKPDYELQEQKPVLTFEEIEREINNSATAARLLAATELLADYPDAKDIVDSQYKYIVENYPQSSAAEKIKLKHQ